MKKLQTKQSLLLSVVAVVLCMAMLVGTTYAWFSESVSSGATQIVSGNLDIELAYSFDGTTWAPLTSNVDLFARQNRACLWEPGYTQYVYLKISNLGFLALTYTFDVDYQDTVIGTNKAGNAFNLSDYIMFGATQQADAPVTFADRQAAITAVSAANGTGTSSWLSDSTYGVDGELLPGASEYISLVVWMPTTVGDDANYKTGTDAPKVNLNLSLFATQVEYESDDFGYDYDADAETN